MRSGGTSTRGGPGPSARRRHERMSHVLRTANPTMNADIGELAERWGPPTDAVPITDVQPARWRGVASDLLLAYWREDGFAGFMEGRFWLSDPDYWQPAVDAWTEGLQLPHEQWIALHRSAFSDIEIVGLRMGSTLSVTEQYGWVVLKDRSDRSVSDDRCNHLIYVALMSASPDSVDLCGFDNARLFDRVCALRGPVGSDHVYGFVLALGLGGSLSPGRAHIFSARLHLELLADVADRRVVDRAALLHIWTGT